jgi:uncharacterized Zn finger protein
MRKGLKTDNFVWPLAEDQKTCSCPKCSSTDVKLITGKESMRIRCRSCGLTDTAQELKTVNDQAAADGGDAA